MPEDRDHLKVPTTTLLVDVALVEREPRRYELFPHAEPPGEPSHETLRQHLEAPEPFLPARDPETGAWTLINKAAVQWASVSPDGDTRQLEMALYDVRSPVRLELKGGTTLDGSFLYSPPASRARVMDHLNQSGRYLELFQGDRVLLVYAAHVLSVRER